MKDDIKETINTLYNFATNENSDYIYDAHGFNYPLISDCIEELLNYITNLQDRIKELEAINEEHRRINGELRKTINEAIEYLEYQIPQLDFEKDTKAKMLGSMALVLLQGKSDE